MSNETASQTTSTSVAVIATVGAVGALSYYYFARVSNPFKPRLLMRIVASAYADDDEGSISAYHGIHHLPLVKVKTLVEGIPGKICPVKTFTFKLPDKSIALNKYIDLAFGDVVKAHWIGPHKLGGGHKSYSPTDVSTLGCIDLTLKIYPDGVNSQLFDQLKMGDTVGMSGPWPPQRMRSLRLPGKFLNVVCYGVGITEAIEVIKGELKKGDANVVTLLYANRYREDAFFKNELAEIYAKHQDTFQIIYVYSRENKDTLVDGERSGRVNTDLLHNVCNLPVSPDDPKHSEQRFLIVGSKQMIMDTWKYLKTFEYNVDDHSLLRLKMNFFANKKERKQKMYDLMNKKNKK